MSAAGPSAPRCGPSAVHKATASPPRTTEVTDNATMIVTSLNVLHRSDSECLGSRGLLLPVDFATISVPAVSTFLAYSSKNWTPITRSCRRFRQTSLPLLYHGSMTPLPQARRTRRLRNGMSCSPPRPRRDLRDQQRHPRRHASPLPARWRCDDWPTCSRATLRTMACFRFGCRAPMRCAVRG